MYYYKIQMYINSKAESKSVFNTLTVVVNIFDVWSAVNLL